MDDKGRPLDRWFAREEWVWKRMELDGLWDRVSLEYYYRMGNNNERCFYFE